MTWLQVPVRRLFRVINGGTPTPDEANWGGGVAWATPIDLARVDGRLITTTQRTLSERGLRTGSRAVKAASLIISTRAPVGYVAQTAVPIAFNQGCRGLEPLMPLDVRFFGYQLSTMTQRLNTAAQGSTFVELSSEAVASLLVYVPSFSEQRAIADFLDAETLRIDALAERRVATIELLSLRRRALIEAAIRGVAGNIRSMPLGYAAAHVEVGIVVTPAAWYSNEGLLALRGINVRPGRIVLDDVVHISAEGQHAHPKSVLRAGDLVVVRTGQAGAAAVVPDQLEGANCIDLVIVRPGGRLLPRYLEYVLNSDWSQKHIAAHSVGTIQSHFNVGAMKHLPLPVPSMEEQGNVVDMLDLETASIDRTVKKMQAQVALFRERRQTLITAAVTGELDVSRGAA